jgi:DNA polymerase-3 subunit beta
LSPAGDKNITMIFNDNRIYFKLDHIDIASKLIEGRYPNYQQVIPEIESRQCVILRQELLANLKRLTYINGSVAFRFTRQQLTLKARSANQDYPGDATEVIDLPAPYSGNFTANAKYFVSLLEAVTDEEIRFQVTAKDQPVVLQGTEKNWISVIMPMQEPKAAPATKAAAPEADAVAATN